MRTYLLAVVVILGLQHVNAAATGKDCDDDKLDECGGDLFIFTRGPKIAENVEELDVQCPKELAAIDCVKDYSQNCLDGIARGMVGILLEGASGFIKPKCNTTSPARADFLKYVPCVNKAGDKFHSCMNQLKLIMEASASADAKHRIGLSCCSFDGYRECNLKAAREVCDEDHVKYIDGIINTYAGDLLDTICINYKAGSPQCNSLPELGLGRQPKRLSILSSLAAIVKTLG